MPWNFYSSGSVNRGERLVLDVSVPRGTVLGVTNEDFTNGDYEYWAVFMVAEAASLDGRYPNVHWSQTCWHRAHSLLFDTANPVDLRPALLVPQSYSSPSVNFNLYWYRHQLEESIGG